MTEQVQDNAAVEPQMDNAVQNPAVETPEVQPDASPKSVWPEDWRKIAAGDDEKLAKLADRYNTPADVLKAAFESQQKIRSGELKFALKPDATPEEIADWRQANGVPESFDKYSLPEGLSIGEDDKAFIDGVLKSAHDNNVSDSAMKSIVSTYYEMQEQAQAQRIEADRNDFAAAEDALRSKFGAEYRANVNQLKSYVTSLFGEELSNEFANARLPNGKALFNDANFVEGLMRAAREANPRATITQADMDKASDRLKFLESKIGSREWYTRNDWQEEYRNIHERQAQFNRG